MARLRPNPEAVILSGQEEALSTREKIHDALAFGLAFPALAALVLLAGPEVQQFLTGLLGR